jgi:tetratricopeptide (TPR) repeat protein
MKNMLTHSAHTHVWGLRRNLNKTIALCGMLGMLATGPAMADEMADVSKLLHSGQLAEALSKTDAFLVQRPKDPQMRFLKGVILTEQNKSTEAIAVFAKLTEDFPDLPEPYNNLAVLYASSGQYEKARAALERAIRTNPTYATAYENLGDVHAKLASQAYDKALQLDSGNSAAKTKLTLVHTLVATSASPTVPKTAAPAAEKPEATKAEPKAESKGAPPSAVNGNPERDAVLSTVDGWAHAWSAKDVKAYLAFYGNNFDTPKGLSRRAWVEERQSRISGKGRISVRVDSPQVTIHDNIATVKFRQIYASDRLTANSRKTLVLTRHGNKWQIQQERTGS